MSAPQLTVVEVNAGERDIALRLPFRFGIVTLRNAPQLFVRVVLRLADGRETSGVAADLLAPKWFDKNPELSNEQNFDQLRSAVALAAQLYRDFGEPATAFALHAALQVPLGAACAARGLNPLIAGFGAALLDRAILDGLGRLCGESVYTMVAANRPGIDARTTPDLECFDFVKFFAGLKPAGSIAARHTVGLVDAIAEADIPADRRLGDGLPESLEAAIDFYGLNGFKLKLGGDIATDLQRLRRIADVLDRSPEPYRATLDGNEQYDFVEPVVELWRRIGEDAALSRLRDAVLFVEQPIVRSRALAEDIGALAALKPVEIDESDATISAFVEARALGYRGVSSKACKGFYRSLLNRARTEKWNAEAGNACYFMSAEDLTTQAGLAVQQDLALASLIGCDHIERNGHHYVRGMAGAPEAEQRAFLAAHGDLYCRDGGIVRLAISRGRIAIGSLDTPGLASAAMPDFSAMRRLDLNDWRRPPPE